MRIYPGRILILVISATVMLSGCKNDLDKVKVEFGDDIPVAITRDFISLYSDSGIVILQIEAPLRNDYMKDEFYSELPEGIKMTFYNDRKKVLAKLVADYALIKGSSMQMSGNVKMESSENGILLTQSLYWNSQDKEITTTDPIEIRQNNKVLFGSGLWAKQDFSEYRILVPTGTFPISDK